MKWQISTNSGKPVLWNSEPESHRPFSQCFWSALLVLRKMRFWPKSAKTTQPKHPREGHFLERWTNKTKQNEDFIQTVGRFLCLMMVPLTRHVERLMMWIMGCSTAPDKCEDIRQLFGWALDNDNDSLKSRVHRVWVCDKHGTGFLVPHQTNDSFGTRELDKLKLMRVSPYLKRTRSFSGDVLGYAIRYAPIPRRGTVSWVICGQPGARYTLSAVIEGYSTPKKERKKKKPLLSPKNVFSWDTFPESQDAHRPGTEGHGPRTVEHGFVKSSTLVCPETRFWTPVTGSNLLKECRFMELFLRILSSWNVVK